MKNTTIQELLGETDIYLIDQIMKSRYNAGDKILDAGCGTGRNMHWFLQNNMEITGIDNNEEAIRQLKSSYPTLPGSRFQLSPVEKMPFPDNSFDHLISSAVLHFASSTTHFKDMFAEMVRVVKSAGSIFIRMATDIGMENKVILISNGVYTIPDGSTRFLLTRSLLAQCLKKHKLSLSETLKIVYVDGLRCMCTLVLQKY
ncbi:MAG: class I SAM-dependent methyltransferase [Bacteroidota bacterium]